MKNNQSDNPKAPTCVGNKCYETLTHTTTVKIPYAQNIEKDCPVIQPVDEAKYVKQARGVFYSFAVAHCKFGDESGSNSACDRPCNCEPELSNISTETLGTEKWPNTNNCYVMIKITGTITCRCEN